MQSLRIVFLAMVALLAIALAAPAFASEMEVESGEWVQPEFMEFAELESLLAMEMEDIPEGAPVDDVSVDGAVDLVQEPADGVQDEAAGTEEPAVDVNVEAEAAPAESEESEYFEEELPANPSDELTPVCPAEAAAAAAAAAKGKTTAATENATAPPMVGAGAAQYTYNQRTGIFVFPNGRRVQCYSGRVNGFINNPAKQCQKAPCQACSNSPAGPIPRGRYAIGGSDSSKGPLTIDLNPMPGNSMCGRGSFRIHGANAAKDRGGVRASSSGCIIMPRGDRANVRRGGVLTVV